MPLDIQINLQSKPCFLIAIILLIILFLKRLLTDFSLQCLLRHTDTAVSTNMKEQSFFCGGGGGEGGSYINLETSRELVFWRTQNFFFNLYAHDKWKKRLPYSKA